MNIDLRVLTKIFIVKGAILTILIALSDLASIYFPVFGKLGTSFWIISYFFLASFSISCLFILVKATLAKKTPFILIMLSIFVLLISTQVNNPASLSGETSIETACAIDHLTRSIDFGYRGTCLFGYPARQHFIPAIPSILFGRDLVNLNLGGSLYFLLGLPIFSYGLFNYFGKTKRADILTAVGLSTFLHFYYFNHFLFQYEQSIFPLSFGLILVGSYLIYLRSNNIAALIISGFSLFYLAGAYTPALSLLSLSLLFLIIHLIKEKDHNIKRVLLVILVSSLIVTLTSLTFREDISLKGSETTIKQSVTDVSEAFKHILLFTERTDYTSQVFVSFFVLTIAASILGVIGWTGRVMAFWIVSVIVFAVAVKGYAYYGIDFRLHRTLVTLPVFVYLFVYTIDKYLKKKKLLLILGIFLLASGLIYNQNQLQQRPNNPHYSFIEWFTDQNHEQISEIIITRDSGRYNNLISLNDNFRYFFPLTTAKYVDDQTFNNRCEVNFVITDSILVPSSNACLNNFIKDIEHLDLSYSGEFVTDSKEKLLLFTGKEY